MQTFNGLCLDVQKSQKVDYWKNFWGAQRGKLAQILKGFRECPKCSTFERICGVSKKLKKLGFYKILFEYQKTSNKYIFKGIIGLEEFLGNKIFS